MDWKESKILVTLGLVLGLFLKYTEGLSCYQCNVFIRGTPWPCNSNKGMRKVDDCHACLKTYTRTYLHNTFFDEILTSYESRVCVKDRDYVKAAGCHPLTIDSGYMKRCFCFDDYCNTSGRPAVSFLAFGVCAVMTIARLWLL
ncbi:uncharacterized protein LOC127835780 [Dreissena polymorpha]|uniref:Protein quiver n=1 Tax=Dreissena polymorpha TaxID=45954 RepID=A0A9D4RZ56_DREPO|nr:uncharacterized protein LOC127835780 [Dreissena polymorpha]KAH3883967.1 hypothetical protein DPMN_007937 [Dreissena polymorpha]